MEAYVALLIRWNRRINLVSRGSLQDLWRRHVLDSGQLIDYLPPSDQPLVMADIGSGAGFPGVVLAILGAGQVHLIEADGRKAAFLREAVRVTGCPAVVHHGRMESLSLPRVDLVTARACAPLMQLLDYTNRLVSRSGTGPPRGLFLKGKSFEEELTAAQKEWSISVERFQSRSDPNGAILRIGIEGRASTKS